MSTSTDTAFDRIPQTDRNGPRGRERFDPNRVPRNARTAGPRPRRFTFSGTSDPLNAIAPDPPTYLITDLQQKQGALGDYVKNSLRAMWDQHIDPEDFSASWRDVGPVMKTMIAQAYDGSAANAAEFYRNYSVVHGLNFPNVHPAHFSGQHLERMAGSVANGSFYHQLNTKGVHAVSASGVARNTLSGAGARFALNGARNTVMAAVARDPQATGWERIIEPEACSYCTQQAAKGPFKPGQMGFRAHDYCSCLAIPVLRGTDTPGPNSELRATWDRITGTFTGKEARAAWDRYWSEHGNDTAS